MNSEQLTVFMNSGYNKLITLMMYKICAILACIHVCNNIRLVVMCNKHRYFINKPWYSFRDKRNKLCKPTKKYEVAISLLKYL